MAEETSTVRKARKEKVCEEETCIDQWDDLPPEVRDNCASFVYCPFCANEMVVRCSACGENIPDFGFKFCPWCGAHFED